MLRDALTDEPDAPGQAAVERVALPAGDAVLGGLLAAPAGPPRALLVALHGSGMTSQYFDCATAPGLSLLRLGAACGYAVLALDRPGYGVSAGAVRATPPEHAALVLEALAAYAATHDVGAGIGLAGHSAGGKVALYMAAEVPGLLGVDVSGVGLEFAPDFAAARAAGVPYGRYAWGPDTLYPGPAREAIVHHRTAAADRHDVPGWPAAFAALGARIAIPVRVTVAEHEGFFPTDDAELARLAALFPRAPVATAVREPHAGHNISLGWAARAHHLKVLAFLEDGILARRA
jgi:pimeloyl-ACP methyl ester carboxylesterase